MKKVIGGAVCDTEKAELIGTNKAGISLYLTQSFVFFLSTFDRLTPDAAERWAQTYLPTEIYKEKFDSFVYKFKKIRNLRGVTLKELAQLSGLSYQSLSGYQCGTITPTLPAIQKIAKGLDCSVSELCENNKHPLDVELEANLRHKTALNLVASSYNMDEYLKIKKYYQEKWNNGESFLGMNLLYNPAPEREGDTEEEIKTIRERNITVKLSDADCERLIRKCGEHGLTVGELIENFVGDLVGGTYSNGSDERMYAKQWFERCWFGMFPEPTLLNHLLCLGYNPEDYLDTLDNIETAIKEKEYLAEHPEEANEEAQYLDDDIADWEEELKDMRADWKPEKEPNMDEELKLIKKWVKERENLIPELSRQAHNIPKRDPNVWNM